MSELKLAERPCPICGHLEVNVVSSQRFQLPSGHPLPAGWDVVTCPQCDFAYADTPAGQDVYDYYYADFSKYEDDATSTGGGASPTDRQRLEDTALLLSNYAGREDTVLDLGCANGGLLAALLKLGYTRLTGVDPSPACAEATAALGVEGLTGSLFAPPVDGRTFHTVVLCHGLEHIRDLPSAVDVLLGLVAPEGFLYVEVPDATRYGGYSTSPFQDFNVEHINHFSHASLSNLFESRGFATVNQGIRDIPTVAGWTYPAIWILLKKKERSAPDSHAWKKDPGLLASLAEYTTTSTEQITGIDRILAPWVASGEPVIIWGVGQLTVKLLAQSSLGKCNIAGFIDSNPGHHGKKLAGIPVFGPEILSDLPHPVIIGSLLHHAAIEKLIVATCPTPRIIIKFI